MTSKTECKTRIKMKGPSGGLNLGNISVDQLRIHASKSHPRKAKKFLALADLIDGKRVIDIARQNRVAVRTVYHWITRLKQCGLEAFEPTARIGRRCHLQTSNEKLALDLAHQAEIADPVDARKLRAISKLILKRRCTDVASDAQISRSTLSLWIKKFNEGGTSALLGTREIRVNQDGRRVNLRRDISPQDIQIATAFVDKRSVRRFSAIVMVMQGRTMIEAAETLKVSKSTVSKWCTSFNQTGLNDLVDKWEKRRRRGGSARFGMMISK